MATRFRLVHVDRPDGARLAVEVSGPDDAERTVLLAHGWTMTRASWRPVVERLRRARPDLRVVSYDQRDHGDSTPARDQQRDHSASMAVLADDLAAVLETVAPSGRLLLAGHSMGGMTVIALAGRRPELVGARVDAVVLVNTAAAGLERRPALSAVMRALAAAPAWVRVPRVPAPLARRLGYGEAAPPEVVAQVREGVKPPTARSVGTWYHALMELDETESLGRLGDVPVVVLAGEADRLTPSRHAEDIVDALPQAHLEVVPSTGHMLPFEEPDRVAACILEQLAPV